MKKSIIFLFALVIASLGVLVYVALYQPRPTEVATIIEPVPEGVKIRTPQTLLDDREGQRRPNVRNASNDPSRIEANPQLTDSERITVRQNQNEAERRDAMGRAVPPRPSAIREREERERMSNRGEETSYNGSRNETEYR